MKTLLGIGLSASLLLPGLATARSAFDGTWKIDTNKAEFYRKPDVFLLQDGMWECRTCVPPIKIKADGQDQTATGRSHLDTSALKVISDHEIESTDKKTRRTVRRSQHLT